MIVTIDALDHYLRVLSRIDGLVPDTLHDKLNGRKVPADDHRPTFYERLDALHAAFPGARAEHLLAMNLLANWRNRFAHGDYKFALTDKECEVIAQTAAFFRDNMAAPTSKRLLIDTPGARRPPYSISRR
jgi:hypothetical protein